MNEKSLIYTLKSIFEVNRPDSAQPDPTVMLFVALYLRTYYTGQKKKTFFRTRSKFIHGIERNDVLNMMLPSDFS